MILSLGIWLVLANTISYWFTGSDQAVALILWLVKKGTELFFQETIRSIDKLIGLLCFQPVGQTVKPLTRALNGSSLKHCRH